MEVLAVFAKPMTKKNLERQIERLKKHCQDKGYGEVKEYSEIGSGLNDNRPKLHKLIDAVLKKEVNHIVVEYKYQVVDGHHRYWAYKATGVKQVPAIIIAPENIRREKVWTPEQ
jgi:predicted site-specific integrase-resolvase